MRRLASVRPGALVTYIPEADGNRADAHPMEVVYREPTERERRRLMAAGESLKVHVGEDGKPDTVETTSVDHVERQARVISELVTEVKNFEIHYGDDIVKIKTGKELAEHGTTALVSEIFVRLSGAMELTGDEKKESPASSESQGLEIAGCNGTAEIVVAEGSTYTETVPASQTQDLSTSLDG